MHFIRIMHGMMALYQPEGSHKNSKHEEKRFIGCRKMLIPEGENSVKGINI